MAFRELDIVDVMEILRRLIVGEKVKRVARSLGFCPKTVRRYRDEAIRRGLLAPSRIWLLNDNYT